MDDSDEEFDVLDTHALYENSPLRIIGVLCQCICGKTFIGCFACIVDGAITMCSSCHTQNEHAHLN